MSLSRVRMLSKHDLQEVEKFREYLSDRQTMPLDDFLRKYQDYIGINDEERKAIEKRGVKP